MELFLRISLLLGLASYFLMIIFFLKKKALNLKYSLLWIISGAIMLILVIFPSILYKSADFLGFASPVNAIFALVLFFMLCNLMSITSIVSKQNSKSKRLTQQYALLEKRVRELEGISNEKEK
jgi:hypothetical protein